MADAVRMLERALKQGFNRWARAKSRRGREQASATVEDALLNLDMMLGRTQHFRAMLRRGDLDINLVERWLKARGRGRC